MIEAGWNEAGSGSIQDKILSCGSKLAGYGETIFWVSITRKVQPVRACVGCGAVGSLMMSMLDYLKFIYGLIYDYYVL